MVKKLTTNFKFSGRVVAGEEVGQTLGFPTANLDRVPNEKELKPGVYAGRCYLPAIDENYNCLAYFGPRYIFGEKKNNFEVYLYYFERDIYGWELEVELGHYLRKPMKFKNREELKAQLGKDVKRGRELQN